jgi:Tol biopolymer transport system component
MTRSSYISIASLIFVVAFSQTSVDPFTFGEPKNLGRVINRIPTGGERGFDGGPNVSADGLTLYFVSDRPRGYGELDLWFAKRKTASDPWQSPVNLGPTVNSSEGEASPSISTDGLELYFDSGPRRPGGQGDADLWVTRRATRSAPWRPPENLGPVVNSPHGDSTPQLSRDGLTLYFSSWRPSGFGNRDLWATTRRSLTEPWQLPTNLGEAINSRYHEWCAAPSPDGLTLIFQSNRPGGLGGDDLYATTRDTSTSPWKSPVHLGTLNTPFEDAKAHFSANGATLYFMSTRPGGYEFFDIWEVPVLKMPKPKLRV